MAKLTKRQKTAIELLIIYTRDAEKELDQNGITEAYNKYCWLCAQYREEIGLNVPDYERVSADAYIKEHFQTDAA